MTNDELAVLSKDNNEAMKELYLRFDYASRLEAKRFYERYKDIPGVEYEDLHSICIEALFTAVKRYRRKNGFYSLWKKITKNLMTEEIVRITKGFSNSIVYQDMIIGENNELELQLACDDDVPKDVSNTILFDQVMEILDNPKYKVAEEDRKMFICFIHDFSIAEISKEFGVTYGVARLRIRKVIKLLKNYFE